MTSNKNKKQHHHGNLKEALVHAGVELLNEGGLSALTLRKCAARAGVSHAAPAHHFDGLKGLLTAIVTRGYRDFAQAMINHRDKAGDKPRDKLIAICDGYLDFAKNNEAICTLMFVSTKFNNGDAEFQLAGATAYQVLADACAPFKPGPAGPQGNEVMVWSLVQGYATLVRAGSVDPQLISFDKILPPLQLQ